jgi:predicted Zn-dependent protease
LLVHHPDDARADEAMIELLLWADDPAGAARVAEASVLRWGRVAYLLSARGRARWAIGNPVGALQDLSDALEREPHTIQFRIDLAEMELNAGGYGRSARLLAGLARLPDADPSWVALYDEARRALRVDRGPQTPKRPWVPRTAAGNPRPR